MGGEPGCGWTGSEEGLLALVGGRAHDALPQLCDWSPLQKAAEERQQQDWSGGWGLPSTEVSRVTPRLAEINTRSMSPKPAIGSSFLRKHKIIF